MCILPVTVKISRITWAIVKQSCELIQFKALYKINPPNNKLNLLISLAPSRLLESQTQSGPCPTGNKPSTSSGAKNVSDSPVTTRYPHNANDVALPKLSKLSIVISSLEQSRTFSKSWRGMRATHKTLLSPPRTFPHVSFPSPFPSLLIHYFRTINHTFELFISPIKHKLDKRKYHTTATPFSS